jgi:hypothetical protein
LPVDAERGDKLNGGSGLLIYAGAVGLPVQAFNDTPLRKKINIKASFPKGTGYESFRVEMESFGRMFTSGRVERSTISY